MSLAAKLGDHILTLGNASPLVREFQLAFRQLGYQLNGTGYFGNATDTVVRGFQKKGGLDVDGDIGPATAAAIDAATGTGSKSIHPDGHLSSGSTAGAAIIAPVGRPIWLEAAVSLIGTKEGAGSKDNRTIIDWAKEEGGDIAAEYTHDSIPWCALFANHVLTKSDLKGTETLWALDFANPKKWPAVRLPGPAVGAFAPMLRNGGGHITIVSGKDQHGNIMGVGGNQSDAVTNTAFALSRLNQGFWWPASVPQPSRTGMASLPIVLSNGQVSHNEA